MTPHFFDKEGKPTNERGYLIDPKTGDVINNMNGEKMFSAKDLDEKGEVLASMALAERIGRWRDDGVREARFLIGAADGFSDAERGEADLLLSFGRATWPHLLARAMLAEQLFRATSILANHPYHREG